ncbi:hypothetical protein [Chromohalobacter sp. 48-RD10]|uniref:hypothetical protein n=1 Tax=Chromohalobacter sp. 48-RD10 TaxID=2994063 RepID=UPI0024692AF1|nr:hypothetical protein [Chromohalobacter sp. 48-RD10]
MRDDFRLSVEWESISASEGDEIRATWARFSLLVGAYPVTRVLDANTKSYRDHILIPLYPIAEWLVAHWWQLLYEPQAPWRPSYDRRHNLRFGREGYLFPDLWVESLDDTVQLTWRASDLSDTVAFVGSGSLSISHEDVRQSLVQWIELVISRLEQADIQDTFLQREWQAIEQVDGEEKEFCIACARMGMDPYQVPKALAEQVVHAGRHVPTDCHLEFFSALQLEDVASAANDVAKARDGLACQMVDLSSLAALARGKPKDITVAGTEPWEQGYRLAAWLRQRLDARSDPLPDDAHLSRLLSLDQLPIHQSYETSRHHWLDALAECNDAHLGGVMTASPHPTGRRFAFGRALCEMLADPCATTLVTTARTARQKRNRAFAAELLAPAEWLRQQHLDSYIDLDALQSSAQALGVSEHVVSRQLQNHHIGYVAWDVA